MRAVRRIVFLVLAIVVAFGVGAQAQEEGDPERGGELYIENCAMCHGADGKGRIGATLEGFSGIAIDSTLEQTIRNGVNGSVMPGWSEDRGGPLTDQDIADIIVYITGVFDGTEPIAAAPEYVPPDIPPIPDVEGDPTAGAVVYQTNCVACHGVEGRGRFGATLAKAWPGNQPSVFINRVVSVGIGGTTMPAWSTQNGGPLSEIEVDNVTAYVISLSPTFSPESTPVAQEGPLSAPLTLIIFGGIGLLVILGLILYYRRA
jgi:mono/diheme cytochrome c family protein